jgi:hypothetical protein
VKYQARTSIINVGNPVRQQDDIEQPVKLLKDMNALAYAVQKFLVELPQVMVHALI